MYTFFLIGSKSIFVKEPNDEFTKLPVVQPNSEHGTMSEHQSDQGIKPQSTGNISPSAVVKSVRCEHSANKDRTEKRGNCTNETDVTVNSNFRTADHNILKIKVKSSTCLII